MRIMIMIILLRIWKAAILYDVGLNGSFIGYYFIVNKQFKSSNSIVKYQPYSQTFFITLTAQPATNEIIQFRQSFEGGLKIGFPPLIYSVYLNQSATSPNFFAKTTITLQHSTNPIDSNVNQINIFFASRGFSPTFKCEQAVNLSVPNFSVSFIGISLIVLNCNQNNTFSGDVNITQFLQFLSVNGYNGNKISSNRIITHVSHFITILNTSDQIGTLEFVARSPKKQNRKSSEMEVENYTIHHVIPQNLGLGNYGSLITMGEPQFLHQVYFESKHSQQKNTNFEILSSVHTDDYVAIGYVNNRWMTEIHSYGLPFAANSSTSLLSNFSFKIYADIRTACAVCFTVFLRNDLDVSTNMFTFRTSPNNTYATIQICPWKSFSFSDGRVPNSDFIYLNISGKSGNVNTYIFPANYDFNEAVVDFDLMKYVIDACSHTPWLWNYSIVGIKAGFQLFFGYAKFQFYSISFKTSNKTSQIIYYVQKEMEKYCFLGSTFDKNTRSYKPNQQLNSVITPILNIPNLGLLLTIGPFVSMLDDLSYLVYMNSNLDIVFKYINQLSWNWTMAKWKFPFGLGDMIQQEISSTTVYTRKWVKNTKNLTPMRFQWMNEDIFFLNNCKGYIFCTVPTSVLFFLLLLSIYRKIKAHYPKISAILQYFSSWAYLLIYLVGDNLQYLAFRSFKQFRFLIPNRGILSFISILMALKINFLVIICATSAYFLALQWSNKTFQPTLLTKNCKACFFLQIWMLTKFFQGFLQAYIDDDIAKISYILFIQIFIIVTSASSWCFARYKTSLLLMVFGQIVRFLLYLLLLFEILFPHLISIIPNQLVLINLSFSLSMCLLITNNSQIICHAVVGLIIKMQGNRNKEDTQKQLDSQQHKLKSNIIRKNLEIKRCQTPRNIQVQLKGQRKRQMLKTRIKIINKTLFQTQKHSNIINKSKEYINGNQIKNYVEKLKYKQNRLNYIAPMIYKENNKTENQKKDSKKTVIKLNIKQEHTFQNKLHLVTLA